MTDLNARIARCLRELPDAQDEPYSMTERAEEMQSVLRECQQALAARAPQGAVEALRRFYDDFWSHAEPEDRYWVVPMNEIEVADEMIKVSDRNALSAAPAEGQPCPDGDACPDARKHGEPNGDAGWLAALVVDRLGGTDDIPAWVRKSAEYYRLLQSENRDLRAGNESLRAECGLRQIQGKVASRGGETDTLKTEIDSWLREDGPDYIDALGVLSTLARCRDRIYGATND